MYYQDSQEFYKIYSAWFERLRRDPKIGSRVAKSKLIVRFCCREPDGIVTLDFQHPPSEDNTYGSVFLGDEGAFLDERIDVTFHLKADISHEFWHGKVNVLAALAKRKIVAKGSLRKALKLLPAIKPAFREFPSFLEDIGFPEKILQD